MGGGIWYFVTQSTNPSVFNIVAEQESSGKGG
jgi:hypothetical protein